MQRRAALAADLPPRAAAGEPSLGALGFILHAAAHVEKATPSNGTPYSQRNVNRDMKPVLKLAKLGLLAYVLVAGGFLTSRTRTIGGRTARSTRTTSA